MFQHLNCLTLYSSKKWTDIPEKTSWHFDQKQNIINLTLILTTHLKGDTGLFIEIDLGYYSPSHLFHIKDASAVRRPFQVNSIADKTCRSALQERREITKHVNPEYNLLNTMEWNSKKAENNVDVT